jgi:hypothetical protein
MAAKLTFGVIGDDIAATTFAAALEEVGHVQLEDWKAADLLLLGLPAAELKTVVDELTAENLLLANSATRFCIRVCRAESSR